MKKCKILSVFICLFVAISSLFLVGCKDKEENGNKALYVVDGFRIESVEVFHVNNNYYNIEIGVQNTNQESATFDYSQIRIFYFSYCTS